MSHTLNQRWAATIVGVLVSRGVRQVVISPGSRSTPLALAVADRPELTLHVVLDERSAAFLALGLSKALQTPAAVICTSGTAGAHFLPALLEAREGATPMIAITADRPSELHGFGAPQTIDQTALFGSAVRASLSLSDPQESGLEHAAAQLAKLLAVAEHAPRGPVHLNAPFREPLAHPDGLAGPVLNPSAPRFASALGVPDLSIVKDAIASTTRGVILVGPRERSDGFPEAIHSLGRQLGFPVFAEAASNCRFGFSDAIWSMDALVRSPRWAERLRPEVVLRFGGGLTLKQPQAWLDASRARVFAFSDDGQPFDPNHAVEAFFTGELVAMCSALATTGKGTLRALALEAQARLPRVLDERTALEEGPIARTVLGAVPKGANVLLASSMPIRDVDCYASSPEPLRVFANRGVNGIDGLVSTAAGIALARGRTVLLVGDVAALHDLSGWLAAKAAPLTVVVVNNDGGGIFSFLPIAGRTPHFERLFGTPHHVDFEAVAKLAGARLHRPTQLAELARAVRASFESTGLELIEVRTDRAANVEAHRSLNAALVAALEAP